MARSIWNGKEDNTEKGTLHLKKLLDGRKIFDFPKSVDMIKKTLQMATSFNSNDIILDFFAGSGTTAEAVMRLNAEDGGNRSFILVQIPQAIDPQKQKEAYRFVTEDLNKPATIFEITAERLRRAGQKIEAEQENVSVDTGFRVFDIIEDTDALILQKPLSAVTQADLNIFIQHNTDSDNRERVLYNLLLSEGLPLTTVINELIPDTVYLADDVLLILGAVDLTQLTDTLKELNHSATPAVYLTVYAPWVRDDNFMLGLKTLAESLGFSSDKLRLRG
jgi:adenine-specific DNA-methyltransferase